MANQTLIDHVNNKSIEELRKLYILLLEDSVDDDTKIRQLAAEVLTDFEINGDSYGVPTIVDIVELLVKKIKK